jgi:hypothetical protein
MSGDVRPAFKVVVEAGPNRGREFALPAAGARVGRSSQNDIALTDPLLSRHHCRFEMRGPELWVVDLASANQTMVGGRPVEEVRLVAGDAVTVGDTVMRVQALEAAVPAAAGPGAAGAGLPVIDLGLDRKEEPAPSSRHLLRPLLWTIGAACVLLLGTLYILDSRRGRKSDARPVPETRDLTLEIAYEKVEADADGIFRYAMTVAPDGTLAIRIDDLKENRHVRKEKKVDPALLRDLSADLLAGGFFKLDPTYSGINSRPGALDLWDLTVVVGRHVQHCRVANRLEPEVFRAVREKLETFGQNELGLWAIQFSHDKLVTKATEKWREGRKKYDERDIEYGNLFAAIQCFREAEFYLETVDPKPDFHKDLADARRQAGEELDRRYREQRFRADRAINLQDWPTAAQELRVLREMLPERGDDRYQEATRKLLDVEARLKKHRS